MLLGDTALKADPKDIVWQDLAACKGIPTWLFFEGSEKDEVIASSIKSICNACPVKSFCENEGVSNDEYGIWGGRYFEAGREVS